MTDVFGELASNMNDNIITREKIQRVLDDMHTTRQDASKSFLSSPSDAETLIQKALEVNENALCNPPEKLMKTLYGLGLQTILPTLAKNAIETASKEKLDVYELREINIMQQVAGLPLFKSLEERQQRKQLAEKQRLRDNVIVQISLLAQRISPEDMTKIDLAISLGLSEFYEPPKEVLEELKDFGPEVKYVRLAERALGISRENEVKTVTPDLGEPKNYESPQI